MGTSGKKRTTMAKLNRENKLRERRAEKQARKDARRREAASPGPRVEGPSAEPAAAGEIV
jgi:hypothetical protein